MRTISAVAASKAACSFAASSSGVVKAAKDRCVPMAWPVPVTRSGAKGTAAAGGAGGEASGLAGGVTPVISATALVEPAELAGAAGAGDAD